MPHSPSSTPPPSGSPQSGQILVIGPSWVGDMVMAQSLFIALKRRAVCEIDVLAPAWSLPILARMPEVRNGISMPLGHGQLGLRTRYQLGKMLAQKRYHQAIVLPGSFKSALVPFFAGIPLRTGFRGEMRTLLLNDMRILDKAALPTTVSRFVSLAFPKNTAPPVPFPVPRVRPDASNQSRLRQLHQLSTQPAIAFMPGAEYGPAKQWPIAHFRALALDLVSLGYQIWVLGSGKDRPAGEEIAQDVAEIRNLAGHTELGDAVDLLALASAAVTNDSGLMHVAAALDLPLVALYGSSSPEHTPPLSSRAVIRTLKLDCAPCFERTCPLGHTRCLTGIPPESVLDALQRLGIQKQS